jgi:hypothetical protein
VAAILVFAQANRVGGMAGLLQVGETSNLRPLIESELGTVPLAPGPGHDGQIFYAIGLDLRGETVPDLLDHGGYRYRRILEPAVASGLGLMDGEALLVSMVVLTIVSAGVAAGATAASARVMGMSEWLALAVLLNPGVWLGVRLLTSDALALATMSLGLLAILVGSRWALLAFSASGLAKDVFLVTPLGLAVTAPRRWWRVFAVPAVVLLIWMTWVHLRIGNGFSARGNIAPPLVGLIDAAGNWPSLSGEEVFYLGFALVTVAGGLVLGVTRRSWLRWSLLGWVVLALVSSSWVWDFGNNAARSFAPIVILVALSFGSPPPSGNQPEPTISRRNLPV